MTFFEIEEILLPRINAIQSLLVHHLDIFFKLIFQSLKDSSIRKISSIKLKEITITYINEIQIREGSCESGISGRKNLSENTIRTETLRFQLKSSSLASLASEIPSSAFSRGMRSRGKTRSVESFLPRGAHPRGQFSFVAQGGRGGERGWSVAALKAVPSGLASAGRFTRRHGRWIGVEMRGKRRLLFINQPSSSDEGRGSGWSWLNERSATRNQERNWLFLPAL